MTILIADDHILFRDTLVTYLSIAKPLQKTVTVNDFHSLFEHIEKSHLKIDFMLIDFSMPDMAGREAFQKLAKHPSNIPYAMMSGVAERDDIEFVMALGARGYLPKTMSGQVLIQAIDKMMAGQIYMPPHDPLSLFAPPPPSSLQVKAQSVAIFQLTPREQDVLNLLEQGLSNNDIATTLNLRPVTVKLHVRGILRKLNLDNRTQAALWSRGTRDAYL